MPRRGLTIWITRAQPGADATAERVRAMGHEAIVAPLLEVRTLPGAYADLSDVAALAFTSANGVRAFADVSGERAIRVFAVGAATGEAARAAGFRLVLSGEGDVAMLADRIAARRRELRGVVLHPGASEPAGDLAGALNAQGVAARDLVLYETAPVTLAEDEIGALLQADAVLLHSPKAARALAQVLKAHPAPNLRLLGLSKAVLQPLGRVTAGPRTHPSMPLEAALLNLIDRSG